jgi:hypothetical protein
VSGATSLGMNPEEARQVAASVRSLAGGLQNIENQVWKARAMSLNPWNYVLDPGSLILAPFSIAIAASASADIAAARTSLEFLLSKLGLEATQQENVSNSLSYADPAWRYSFNTPKSQHGNNTSPYELFFQWVTGTGPRDQFFTDGDPLTEQLQQHPHFEDARNYIRDAINDGVWDEKDELIRSGAAQWDYSLGGPDGAIKYLKDYATILTFGRYGNLAVAYLGSQQVTFEVLSVNDDGTVTVKFHSTNESTLSSATHPPVIGYTDWWTNNIGDPLDAWAESIGGPFSKTQQTIEWTETFAL